MIHDTSRGKLRGIALPTDPQPNAMKEWLAVFGIMCLPVVAAIYLMWINSI